MWTEGGGKVDRAPVLELRLAFLDCAHTERRALVRAAIGATRQKTTEYQYPKEESVFFV